MSYGGKWSRFGYIFLLISTIIHYEEVKKYEVKYSRREDSTINIKKWENAQHIVTILTAKSEL